MSFVWNFFFQTLDFPQTYIHIIYHVAFGSVLFSCVILGGLGIMSLAEFMRSMHQVDQIRARAANENQRNENHERVNAGMVEALFDLLLLPYDVDDDEIAEEEENMEFEEMLGLKGSLVGFFWHLVFVFTINVGVIGVFFLLPFVVGRSSSKYRMSCFSSTYFFSKRGFICLH